MNDAHHSNKLTDQKAKPSRSWWPALMGLLAASAVPCPGCGSPLALHLWPLVLAFIAARALGSRSAKNTPNAPSDLPDFSTTEKE